MQIQTSVHVLQEVSSQGVTATVLATEFNQATATIIHTIDPSLWHSIISWIVNLI